MASRPAVKARDEAMRDARAKGLTFGQLVAISGLSARSVLRITPEPARAKPNKRRPRLRPLETARLEAVACMRTDRRWNGRPLVFASYGAELTEVEVAAG